MSTSFIRLALVLAVAAAPAIGRGEPAAQGPAQPSVEPWIDALVAEAQQHLGATVCLGGLEAAGCRHRLLGVLDRAADFDALAASVLRGLDAPDAPDQRARFRDALRAVLVRTWERRLEGSARVRLEVVDATATGATLRLTRGRDSVEVVVTLASASSGPRIANVGVDGADVVHTWRPRIALLLREGTWDAMIDALEQR